MNTLTSYRPNTIQNALSDFDRYFENFFGDSIIAPAARLLNQLPAVDIRETENDYVLEMNLPGYDEKNIDIHIDGTSLTIACNMEEKKEKKDDSAGTYLLRERRINSFSRSFKLPENANPEDVSASFKNGILVMNIKKRAEAQKRAIKINVN